MGLRKRPGFGAASLPASEPLILWQDGHSARVAAGICMYSGDGAENLRDFISCNSFRSLWFSAVSFS